MFGVRPWSFWMIVGTALVVMTFATSIGAQQEQGKTLALVSSHDLEFYVSPLLVDFVRPGLTAKLENPTIAADGTLTVGIRITDNVGLPLDRNGVFSPGAVSMSFIAAHLPSEKATYVAYTTRLATGVETGVTATQASSDSGGSYEQLADGLYRYTFGTKLPAGYPQAETHAIGVYATRDLRDFRLDRQYSNDVMEFVPNGSAVIARREQMSTDACNTCHDPLALHGDRRQEVRLCILCHNEQTSDPDTGNTVDMKVMIHKIHRGSDLPSVQAGTPYQIIGFRQSVHDYSEVVFPDDIRRCEHCHQGGTQSLTYLSRPTRAACGSCHDDVDFTTGESHAGIPQFDDTKCVACHVPLGTIDFDISVANSHTIPREATGLQGIVFKILGVEDGTAGNVPTVQFSIEDKAGNPVDIEAMSRLALVLAGPTTDFNAYVSENARTATGSNGIYFHTFSTPIDANFTGTMAVGIEGYRTETITRIDETTISVRDAGFNDVFYFETAGGTGVERRQVVKLDGCNSCHGNFSIHGDNRNNPEHCVLCHTALTTDEGRRPEGQGASESVHLKTMIHKIHTGAELDEDFTVYGFGNRPHNYNKVVYPGDRRNCVKCHVEGTEQLPLALTLEPSLSPRGLVNPLLPEAAACVSCHTSRATLIHTTLQTSVLGESCAVCHGPTSEFSVDRVHAR